MTIIWQFFHLLMFSWHVDSHSWCIRCNSRCVTFTFLSFITIFVRLLRSPCMPITQLLHCHFSRPVTIFEYWFSWLFFYRHHGNSIAICSYFEKLSVTWKYREERRSLYPPPRVLIAHSMHEKHPQTFIKFPPIMLRYNLR